MPRTVPAECDRAAGCLNFHLEERQDCGACGVRITMNHFHDTRVPYRICDDCFRRHLPAILAGTYRPPRRIEGEVRACRNHERCFEKEPYGLFVPKVCDRCGRGDLPEHYHDVDRNIRLCLACCRAVFSEAAGAGEVSA